MRESKLDGNLNESVRRDDERGVKLKATMREAEAVGEKASSERRQGWRGTPDTRDLSWCPEFDGNVVVLDPVKATESRMFTLQP